MRKLLLCGAAAVMTTCAAMSSAMAADIEPEPVAFDWSGFYIGGHIGYGEAYYGGVWTGSADIYDLADLDLAGVVGGLHAGFNKQFDMLVVGIEGDIDMTDWSDSKNPAVDYERMSADIDYLATIRARIGVAFDNFLVFGTGGIAWSDAEYSQKYTSYSDDSVKFNKVGAVFGGGAEYAFNETFSLRAEGLYYIFDDKEDTGDFDSSYDEDDHAEFKDAFVVRIGASIHFNPWSQ